MDNQNIKEILDINIGNDREAYIDYIDKDGKRKNYEYIEAEALLDYITNLQDRIDKAIEYFEGMIKYYNGFDDEKSIYQYLHRDTIKETLKILKGE